MGTRVLSGLTIAVLAIGIVLMAQVYHLGEVVTNAKDCHREQPELVFEFKMSNDLPGHYNGFRGIDPSTGKPETDQAFYRRCAKAACDARDEANRELAGRGK